MRFSLHNFVKQKKVKSREKENPPRNALFPLPPAGPAQFFCEKIWGMKTTLQPRLAAGLGGLGCFSFCERFFSFWKKFFQNGRG